MSVRFPMLVMVFGFMLLRSASSFAADAAQTIHPDSPPLAPTDSLAKVHVPAGFVIELVASEPLVVDPTALDWGPDGRLWVVEMADYPNGIDDRGKPGGRVRVLEDTDGDGRYDRSTLFADGLNFPNGLLVWRDGVLVTAAPEILYLADTTGDGQADVREVVYSGFLEGNQQLRVNGLRWGLDNWIYCASGGHYGQYGAGTKIKSVRTGLEVTVGSRDFRIRPDEGMLDPQSGPSQFGRNRDDWGHWFGVQNSFPLWHYVLADHYTRRNPNFAPPDGRRQFLSPPNPRVYALSSAEKRFHSFEHAGRYTSACSATIYRDALLFGEGNETHSFTCEPFHNVVQHNILSDDGVSFTARRGEAGESLDFFASADRWCRPVMVRTGPDGALYVADMYRYIIEHPHWLPDTGKDELRPYYRAGDDRGRIYRIYEKGRPPRPVPRLDRLDTTGLVAQLTHPNGLVRDRAQQMLLWRGDAAAVPALKQLLAGADRPLARLHALCTLDGLGALDAAALVLGLRDGHRGVRREAIRLAETRGRQFPEVVVEAAGLATDPDIRVRFQLAASAGYWDTKEAATALARVAVRDGDDPFTSAMVLSSITRANLPAVLEAIQAERRTKGRHAELLAQLLSLAAAMGADESLTSALDELLAPVNGGYLPTQLSTLAGLLDALARRKMTLESVVGSQAETGGKALARYNLLQATIPGLVATETNEPDLRSAAVGLLVRSADRRTADLALLSELLGPRTPAPIQVAAVRRLAGLDGDDAARTLLSGWRSQSPALRRQTLAALLSRPAWIVRLLDAVESQEVLIADLDAATRQRLTSSGDAKQRARAGKLLASTRADDRRQVLESLREALSFEGDRLRGAVLFKQKCAACHQQDGEGHEVGPNLASLTDKSGRALLESLLDPSRTVESKYQAYVASTADGRVLTGILAEETGSSITLLAQEGKREVVLRRDLEELRSTGKSLMPDGLEKDLKPQDFADLIRYVQGP